MASGKKVGTVLVLVALLFGLAAAAGMGSYLLMSPDDGTTHTNDAAADGDDADADGTGDEEADGADPEAQSDADILAELEGMDEADDTGAPKSAIRSKLSNRRKSKGKSKGGALSKSGGKRGSRTSTKTTAAKTAVSNEDCSKISGVTKHSDTHYTLSDAFVAKYIKDMSTGQKQGSAGWATDKSGKRRGVRIKRLRCAPRVAGLKNKDAIIEISGHRMTTTASAMLAYGDVKKADSFVVKVYRKGTPMTLKYDVGAATLPPAGAGAEEAPAEGEGAAPAGEEGAATEGSAPEGSNEGGGE